MWMVLLAALVTASDVTENQTRVVQLPPGKPLSIEMTVGSLRIVGWDRPTAEIFVERRAPSADHLLRMPLFIDDTPERVHVMVQQMENGTDPTLRAAVTVRVPRTALLDRVKVLEGKIEMDGFRGSITAAIQRGPIDGKDLSGTLRLESGIGSVTLINTRLSADGLLRLRTFNGDVKLTLAERPANARIMALALNGHVTSDIPLTHRNTWGPRWAEATLGKGEPVISLDVVTGRVEIKAP